MLFGLYKTKGERAEEEREARYWARFEQRRMYSPRSNKLIGKSQGLLRLAEREVAYRDNSDWTNNMLQKAAGLAAI